MPQTLLLLALLLSDDQLTTQQPGVTKANVQRIQPGMSRKQVEAILGGPGEVTRFANAGRNCVVTWIDDKGIAQVGFDTFRIVKPGTIRHFDKADEWLADHARFVPREYLHLLRIPSRMSAPPAPASMP